MASKEKDPTEQMSDYIGKLNKSLSGLDSMLKNSSAIKEEEKVITKIGAYKVVLRRMSNGITTVEYQNKEDQKKHFDSLKK